MKNNKKETLNLDKVAEYLKPREADAIGANFTEKELVKQLSNFVIDFYQKKGVDLSSVTCREDGDKQVVKENELAHYKHNEKNKTGEIVYMQGLFSKKNPIETLLTLCHEYSHAYQYIGKKFTYDMPDYQQYKNNGGQSKDVYNLLWATNKSEFNADNMAGAIVYKMIKEIKKQKLISNKEALKIYSKFFQLTSKHFNQHALSTVVRKLMPKNTKQALNDAIDSTDKDIIEEAGWKAMTIRWDLWDLSEDEGIAISDEMIEQKIKEAENEWFDEKIKDVIKKPLTKHLVEQNLEKVSDEKLIKRLKKSLGERVEKWTSEYMLYSSSLRKILIGKSVSEDDIKTLIEEINVKMNLVYQEAVDEARARYNKDKGLIL